MNEAEKSKMLVGTEAAKYVKDGMKVGLGSGSTAYWMVKALGERVQQGLDIIGVPTSAQTEKWAQEFGVPTTDLSEVSALDITIDGADEVDQNLQLIKGGGGALLREKMVAIAADKLLIIVDQSKVVDHLGEYPLPIEVVPFGWNLTAKRIAALGYEPTIRLSGDTHYITDNGNIILDCKFGKITQPAKLHEQLIQLVGVVETGLFINMTDTVIVGNQGGINVLEKK
ncbi:ribose-5-phosphate isomerase RpiA [Paraliobacillus sediminis]|uniref:ribose-5-phosphate isomerase RpiA n=1 Tax=Paraliobacillus sediminis TaxID=1885916 RepID=UPI000E3D99A5|nr:ribose-5-phosphate isomerase RpiA [Paraliobacillus sediminis]